jgi:hypothetical protein
MTNVSCSSNNLEIKTCEVKILNKRESSFFLSIEAESPLTSTSLDMEMNYKQFSSYDETQSQIYKKIFGIQGVPLCTFLSFLPLIGYNIFLNELNSALENILHPCPYVGDITFNKTSTNFDERLIGSALQLLGFKHGYYQINLHFYDENDSNILTINSDSIFSM